jgi:large subunit ribosomal protein L17
MDRLPLVPSSGACVNKKASATACFIMGFRKLNRTSAHRWAMLRYVTQRRSLLCAVARCKLTSSCVILHSPSTQVTQLIEHERIHTTLPKAKELRRVAEQVVTYAKRGDPSSRKRAEAVLRTPAAVDKLFGEFAERYAYVQEVDSNSNSGTLNPIIYSTLVEQRTRRWIHARPQGRLPERRRRRDGRDRIRRPVRNGRTFSCLPHVLN